MEHPYNKVLEACNACIDACNRCITESLKRADMLKRFEFIRQLRDCIDTCMLTLSILTRQSPYIADVCTVCSQVCFNSAQICDTYEDETTANCASQCRMAADACRNVLTQLSIA